MIEWKRKKKTSLKSKLLIFLGIYILGFAIRVHIYKSDWTVGRGNRINFPGHTWEETKNNLPNLFIQSSIIVSLFIFYYLYTVRDKRRSFVCDKCFTVKESTYDNNCKCGGVYVSINDMESVSNDEKEVVDLEESKYTSDKTIAQILRFYKSLDKLPSIFECPGCLSEVILDADQRKNRKYFCKSCDKEFDLSIPLSWMTDGKIDSFRRCETSMLENGKFSLSWSSRSMLANKIKAINSYRDYDTIPAEIKCPRCSTEFEISENRILERIVTCPHCLERYNFNKIESV